MTTPSTTGGDPAMEQGWELVRVLSEDIGERVAGTRSEELARDRIVQAFEQLGLPAQEWPLQFVGWQQRSSPSLQCWLPDGTTRTLRVASLGYTGSTSDAGITGEIYPDGTYELVPNLIEWPRFSVKSQDNRKASIVVVPFGQARPFARQERQLVVTAPSVIVGADEFGEIQKVLRQGGRVMAQLCAQGEYVPNLSSSNIIVDLPGEQEEVVIVSGHYDTVAGTAGAGDNGSGVGGCLALAHRYLGRRRQRTLRFVMWGAHEVGLIGSQAYVLELAQRHELHKVDSAVALDILSDGDRLGVWSGGPRLSSALTSLAAPPKPYAYPVEFFNRDRSETDSWSFAERGIDTVMLLTLPYPHFHLESDTIGKNDRGLFQYSVEIADRIVTHLMGRSNVDER